MSSPRAAFTAVTPIGALLPPDMLGRIAEGKDVSGAAPSDYHVAGSTRSVQDDAERHWDYLRGLWQDLRSHLPLAPAGELPGDATGRARRDWMEPLLSELGFGHLAPQAEGIHADDDPDRVFPISHRWHHVPIHLVPWSADLDRRTSTGRLPPQSLVQECLNRTDGHLWAILSNGRQLRLLRDSTALAGSSYVEFDLEAIFDGELVSEFLLLYRLLHVSRFEVPDGSAPSACRLERWRTEAIDSGVRALEQLRTGVRQAIEHLGTGVLRHPDNTALRESLDVRALHTALLRLVYRLLFLFVAEDRDALLDPDGDDLAKERYRTYFGTARLRRHAQRRRGTTHGDLFQALRLVLDGLGSEGGRPELALPGLGGIFDDTDADAPLHGVSLANNDLLAAVRALCVVRDPAARRFRTVDYRHLGAEELGSVYESLLELVPQHDPEDRSFHLNELPGNARKTTGSYYTPRSLIDCLLDTALDPVIDDAVKRGEQEAARRNEPDAASAIDRELLALTVCDPACGSGHFLVAAARRIAKRLAAVRERNPEPTIDAVRTALRDVISRCVYGVDINPMAVELAKVSLWLEALEPGKALGFLDAHIKRGNALLGTTPALLDKGIPDDAFKPIEGDDRKFAAFLRKTNASERSGQDSLFDLTEDVKVSNTAFASSLRRIIAAPADDLRAVHDQAAAYDEWQHAPAYLHARHVADAWCAAFVWPKHPDSPQAPTEAVFRALQDPDGNGATAATNEEIVALARDYAFFHWHLEFPDVFQSPPAPDEDVNEGTGWSGGFSCVLGNPPWERIKLQEQEFFAQREPAIANAVNAAARKVLIRTLKEEHPELHGEFAAAKRTSEGERHLLRSSEYYPLTGRGDVNTYAVFAELDRSLTGSRGQMGVVLPLGIGTDATTAPFFADLLHKRQLVAYLGFENEGFLLSRAVGNKVNFCLMVSSGRTGTGDEIAFSARVRYIEDLPQRRYTLSPQDILLVNPNTGTCPVFRTPRDASITIGIYRRVPVLLREGSTTGNHWNVSFTRMFHMADDSGIFEDSDTLEAQGWIASGNRFIRDRETMLPLYEAKMLHHYDHRCSTYEGATEAEVAAARLPQLTALQHDSPDFPTIPRYWVNEKAVDERLLRKGWEHGWLLGWRDISPSTNERTVIASAMPRYALGHTFPLFFTDPHSAPLLLACLSSFILDYIARQKIGGAHLTIGCFTQFAIPAPTQLISHDAFITPRVLELAYTAHDMAPFARDLGDDGGPFRWDDDRRFVMRCELDALFFHLYGIAPEDVNYIMETFPLVKRKDEAAYGCYRTKDMILGLYDRMAAEGVALDKPLADPDGFSALTPPPGQGPRHPLPVPGS